MKSLAELEAIRQRTLDKVNLRREHEGTRIVVGMATCGIAAGARPVLLAFMDEVNKRGLLDVTVIPPLKAYRIPGAARRLIDGTFLRQKEVLSFRAGTVEVLPSDGRHDIVEVDGEITGTLPVRLEVLPDRINVLHRD